jgi:hypothetical protein
MFGIFLPVYQHIFQVYRRNIQAIRPSLNDSPQVQLRVLLFVVARS